jgi:hypothetical protein
MRGRAPGTAGDDGLSGIGVGSEDMAIPAKDVPPILRARRLHFNFEMHEMHQSNPFH